MEKFKTQQEIESKITELGFKISQDLKNNYPNKDVVVVGNLKGAFMFVSQLVKSLHSSINVEIEFIKTTRFHSKFKMFQNISVENKVVLFVDDIVDSGETLEVVKENFNKLGLLKFLSTSLLIRGDKLKSCVDYYIYNLKDTTDFVIGYGMDDVDGTKRNLPDLYLKHN